MKTCRKIREAAEEAIQAAIRKGKVRRDAVNWADLRVVQVERCEADDGDIHYSVTIEEASPEAHEFQRFVREYIAERLGGCDVVVNTEW